MPPFLPPPLAHSRCLCPPPPHPLQQSVCLNLDDKSCERRRERIRFAKRLAISHTIFQRGFRVTRAGQTALTFLSGEPRQELRHRTGIIYYLNLAERAHFEAALPVLNQLLRWGPSDRGDRDAGTDEGMSKPGVTKGEHRGRLDH